MHISHGSGLCNNSLPCLYGEPESLVQYPTLWKPSGEGRGMHVPHVNFKSSIFEEEAIRMWL